MRPWEMQDDAADGADDLHADRDERLPQPRHLRPAKRGPVGAELDLLKEALRDFVWVIGRGLRC